MTSQVHGILEARGQNQAQQSANRMEDMTKRMKSLTVEMHGIAQKTQKETVSMRIITLVTLFFLPGTFIAVCAGALSGLIMLMAAAECYEHQYRTVDAE